MTQHSSLRARILLLSGASAMTLLAAQPALGQQAGAMGAGRAATSPRPANGTSATGAPRIPTGLQRSNALRARAASAADLAVQAQKAARAAGGGRTLTGPTLNGLGIGALDFGSRVRTRTGEVTDSRTWQGADLPSQTTGSDGNVTVTIKQDEAKAILNWDTFNVGNKTTLIFDQSAGNTADAPKGAQEWIALNRVHDATAKPSEILGSIKAEGQVYVVNRGGIIFGGASQINVHTLAASSLRLTDEQFLSGINTTVMLRLGGNGNAIAAPTFGEYGPAATNYLSLDRQPLPGFVPGEVPGDVVIEKGAQIDAADGGKVMAFAPHVRNSGRLTAKDGQVILAAGEQVYLKASVASQLSDEKTVRGFDVITSAPARYAFSQAEYAASVSGTYYFEHEFARSLNGVILPEMEARAAAVDYRVTNDGIVLSEFGNITLQARTIDQNGILEATTGLNNREGSIRLQAFNLGMWADYTDYDPRLISFRAGTLNLGQGSVTAVSPDLTDTTELEGEAVATRYAPGRIELRGKAINIKAEANVIATAGDITIRASALPGAPVYEPQGASQGISDGSSIDIGRDAFVSVAGLQDILVDMERNVVLAELRINELRDSPLYRDSFLRGRTVFVDRRASGSFESGPMAGVKWLGDQRPGDWVGTPLADVSQWIGVGRTDLGELSTKGGTLFFNTGGALIARDNSMLDVGGGSVRYRDGFVQTTRLIGADGKLVDIGQADPNALYLGIAEGFQTMHRRWGLIDTWSTALSGRGRFERGYVEGRDAGEIQMYAGGAVVLDGDTWGGVITGEGQGARPATAGTWTFGDVTNSTRPYLLDHLVIGKNLPKLADDNSNLDQFHDPDAPIFERKTTYVEADSLSESGMGMLDFNYTRLAEITEGTVLDLTPGSTFRINANIDEGRVATANVDGTIRVAGGSVLFTGRTDAINLGADAVIDVSGMVINELRDGPATFVKAIDGGRISLDAGTINADQGALLDVSGGGLVRLSGDRAVLDAGDGGTIDMQGITSDALNQLDFRGHAAGVGGSISVITASDVLAGSDADPADGFVLPANGYADRGFRTLRIQTSGDVVLGAGTDIRQRVTSIDLTGVDLSAIETGTDLTSVGKLAVLPDHQRAARGGSELILQSANLTLAAGASITADIAGTINLTAGNDATIAGRIDAPAGNITILGQNGTLTLEETARITARGVPLLYKDAYGRTTGTVLSGGTVNLTGSNLALKAGAAVDVTGASGTIQLPTSIDPLIPGTRDLFLASNGGTIGINGGGLVESTFIADAGGEGAIGGRIGFGVQATGSSPARQLLLDGLMWYTEACNLYGNCTPEAVAGSDIAKIFELFWGPTYLQDVYGFTGQILITQELVDALPGTLGGDLILSNNAAGGGGGRIDLADYGLSPLAAQILLENLGVDLNGIVDVAANSKSLVVRPGSFAGGGFSGLTADASGKIILDKLDLSFGGRVTLNGALTSNGTSSSVSARHIVLGGVGDPAATLAGKLKLTAELIDIGGVSGESRIAGFETVTLEADNLRFMRGSDTTGSGLTVDGALVLRAGLISPGTGADAEISSPVSILIEKLAGSYATPLSAGGSLNFAAPTITHNGALHAPFGSITFNASEQLTLGNGSFTSVSGDGLILPYGTLFNSEQWFEGDYGLGQPAELLAPPDKRVSFTAPNVDVQSGAVIDTRGGGDIYGWEFVPGPGGSHDILALPGMFAILPQHAASLSPELAAAGQRVWLAGGGELAAGWYTLLPARYAAVPGAYAVMNAGSGADFANVGTSILPDGSIVMAGRRDNGLTGESDAIGSAWRVYSGETLRRYTEYNEALGNDFFASSAFRETQYRLTGKTITTPRLARDGGSVVFSATDSLNFDGTLRSQAATGGAGGLVDISAARIAVVADAGLADPALDGYLKLDAGTLSGFGAGSLLLGGVRSGDLRGLRVDVTATDILIANDESTSLRGAEIILAARDNVTIAAGADIRAEGTLTGASADLVLTAQGAGNQGALVRVSNASQVRVLRDAVNGGGGVVSIAEGARVDGGNALLIDATDDTLVAGAQISGRALSLASGSISFGGTGDGLIIGDETLAQLAGTRDLTLRSYSSIDFYRGIDLSDFDSVNLDAPALVGRSGDSVALSGKRIVLSNSGGGFDGGSVTATGGALSFSGADIVLSDGVKQVAGFADVSLNASGSLLAQGNGSLDVGGAELTLTAGQMTGSGGAQQTVRTTGALALKSSGTAPAASVDSLGTRWSFTGGSVAVSGRINALGGSVELAATNGDLVLSEGALIDVSGFGKRFFDVEEYADAGAILLRAAGAGSVLVNQGAKLDLSGASAGGAAGRLSTSTSAGAVSLAGEIDGRAVAGERGGAFDLQIDQLPNFAALNQRLNEGGFSYSRAFRIRTGDVTVDGLTEVGEFSLIADAGKVNLTGTIDARSTYGGRISISAGNGVTMANGAQLLAGATHDELGSGRVTIEASGGSLALEGGTIDVGGGEGGRVRLRAVRSPGNDDVAVTALGTRFVGARSTVLEAVRVYQSDSVDAVRDQASADAVAFAGNADTIQTRLGRSDVDVMAGIEIRSAGDLTLGSDWNLGSFAQDEGGLTLRAAGNLIIKGNLSDGFTSALRSGLLLDADSWDIRLVAGADLGSASAMSVQLAEALPAGKGSILVGDSTAGYVVRTGTGDLSVAAGRDLKLGHVNSAIYTAGRLDTTPLEGFAIGTQWRARRSGANPDTSITELYAGRPAEFAKLGGHLDIRAQGDVVSEKLSSEGTFFSEWLARQGWVDTQGAFTGRRWDLRTGQVTLDPQQTAWWIDYEQFAHGVGALGGGNLSLDAGGDVVDLLAALAGNGRVTGGRTPTEAKNLVLGNGGLMEINAVGAVRGGQYYLGRGEGEIVAGEFASGRSILITPGNQAARWWDIAPIIALGDAQLSVRTAGDLRLQTVVDPLMVRKPSGTNFRDETYNYGTFMFSYTDRTALELVSVGGDVTLVNQNKYLTRDTVLNPANGEPGFGSAFLSQPEQAVGRYPMLMRIAALNGDVRNDGLITTIPGIPLAGADMTRTELRILAAGDIELGLVTQSRAAWDASSLVTLFRPGFFQDPRTLELALRNENTTPFVFPGGNPDVLPLANDFDPSRIYALTGSISAGNHTYFPEISGVDLRGVRTNEATWFRAGQDIRNMQYFLRNIHPTDVSMFEAGNDIIGLYTMVTDFNNEVEIVGPGSLILSAGRDIYGRNFDVWSYGNKRYDANNRVIPGTEISGLPDAGAEVTMIAGLNGKTPEYAAFLAAYLDPANLGSMPDYLKEAGPDGVVRPIYFFDKTEERVGVPDKTVRTGLISFMAGITGETLSPDAAWTRFQALKPEVQQRFVRDIYIQELRAAGQDQLFKNDAGIPRNGGYNRGYAAIEKLFPGKEWDGDINFSNALVRTMGGGDIQLIAPGGGAQIASLNTAAEAGRGLVTLGFGNVEIATRDDVVVNRSRVLTFAGGDEVIWSTLGDIDAGRGAKTVRVPTAPEILYDPDGNVEIRERADISGSGIGTIRGFTEVEPGDVILVAPEGTVNAGDAGIRVSGNLYIAALQVLNADNIDVEGETFGVPKPTPVDVGLNLETSSAATAAAQEAAQAVQQNRGTTRPTIITVTIDGFGLGTPQCPEGEEGCAPE